MQTKRYTAIYETGNKQDFKAREYYIAKKRAVYNQRTYGRLLKLLAY